MKRKIVLWQVLLIVAVSIILTSMITILFSLEIFNNKVLNITEKEKLYSKISEVDRVINQYYVDEYNIDDIVQNAAIGMVSGLKDRYSRYLNKQQMQDYLDSSNGTLVGIGISVKLSDDGYIEIVSVYENSPASLGGVLKGDIILKVNDKDVKEIGYESAVNSVRGTEGSFVDITFKRNDQILKKKIERKKIEVTSVESRMIGNDGYIKIIEFNQSTIDQFKKSLKSLSDSGAKSIIFDVRNNLGGTLDSVVAMLDMLLPEGPIVSATYKGGKTSVLANSDAKEINLPMVVLANSNTASAGELFTAALKDYNKASIVGEKTYGKGVMQTLIPLSDGTGVNLTTAYFNPPKSGNFNNKGIKASIVGEKTYGKGVMQTLIPLSDGTGVNLTTAYFNPPKSGNFNNKGILPDIEVKLTDEQKQNFINLDENTDPQLKTALELLNK